MNIKLGYYPFMDMLLSLRQLYSIERFKPYNDSLSIIESKMVAHEKAFIQAFGEQTNDWLDVIGNFIDFTLFQSASPEEIILDMQKNPKKVFTSFVPSDSNEAYSYFKLFWQSYFNQEIAKNNQLVFDKLLEFSEKIDSQGIIGYISSFTDRVEIENNLLRFLIKPEHQVEISSIENIIVMPSVFASRNFTFWHQGGNYIFYLSIHALNQHNEEPTDMMLLKTLALNDRTRLKMLRLLSSGNYSTTEMAEKLNINASTASRHFKVFKDAGFADVFSQDGNSIYYSLKRDEIAKSFDLISKFIKGEV